MLKISITARRASSAGRRVVRRFQPRVLCAPALPTNPLAVFNGLRQHQLRAGRGGDNPGRKDAHGNTVYRCNVHGQYRLHFTRDGAERVTFLSVNTHDDLLL